MSHAVFNIEDIILSSTSIEMPYKPKHHYDRGRLKHRGQRKLLINEILFLTTYGHLSSIVVYAGAAPGIHIPFLSKLFPNHSFTLFDPNPYQFSDQDDISRISPMRGYFTDDIAKAFTSLRVLFISDIRTANHVTQSPMENELNVLKDIQNQIKWVHIIKPVASMLKFRCLYTLNEPENPNVSTHVSTHTHVSTTDFFGGSSVTIYKQPWAGESSSETRVMFAGIPPLYRYNNKWYENCMYYHNNCIRSNAFDHKFERFVIKNYLMNNNEDNKNDKNQKCKIIIDNINSLLGYI